MAEYLSPEVYIEEIPSGLKPIQGVGTSTAAFVGLAQKGPFGVAVPITNFSQFLRQFGSHVDGAFLAFAVSSFFSEGGSSCYVVRTCHYAAPAAPPGAPKQPTAVAAFRRFMNAGAGAINVLRLTAESAGTWGNDLSAVFKNVTPAGDRFLLELRYRGNVVGTFDNLTMDASSPDYAVTRINAESTHVVATDMVPAASVLTPAQRRPAATPSPVFLATGDDGLTALVAIDFTGEPDLGNGFYAFDLVDSINIVAVPESVDRAVHLKGIAYCELRKDCLYVADSQATINTADEVLHYKLAQGIYSGQNSFNSKYAALYAPWIYVFDPRTGKDIKVPPSGAVAGRYAGVDSTRGVHKAPAGVEDGRLLTVLDVAKDMSDADQAKLNPAGINVIRKLPGVGPVLWGARTVSADPEWMYLNVRRFFLFVEQSVEASTKWTVFEPNGPALWKAIELNVSAFLRTQWSLGALVGLKEEQAFYVKCDAETNPPESVDLGRVITEVGLAVVKPAEFVILRFSQFAAKP
jgi:Bacteriophage tail sheath protein